MATSATSPSVQKHLKAMRDAGVSTQKFLDALTSLQRDPQLSDKQRDALRHMVGLECSVWYLEALAGVTIDREKAARESREILARYDAQDPKPPPELPLFELLTKDIAGGPVAT
jgi:hypothetical protein